MEHKTYNMEHRTWNIKREEYRAANARRRNFSYDTRSMLHGTCSRGFPGSRFWRWTFVRALRASPKFTTGFSIIETIVAIAILSITMVAPLTIAQRGLNSSIYARDQVTAFFLAQEAIEYARNIRDTNNLIGRSQSGDWLKGLGTCQTASGCGVDVNTGKIIDCSTDAGKCQLTFDPETGIYGERRNSGDGRPVGGLQDSIFTRKLFITSVDIGTLHPAADVAATVSWKTGKIQKSITVNTRIFDWYPSPL